MSQEPLVTEDLIARQPPEAQAIIRLLLARIAELDARVSELEARLNKTPRNSSLPPSTEHPHAKPAPQKESSGKKQGGQPGHAKYERPLIPVEQCAQVVPAIPEMCRRCGKRLAGCDPEPLRHQVWDIPEIRPLVTEYQLHRLMCPRCSIRADKSNHRTPANDSCRASDVQNKCGPRDQGRRLLSIRL